MSNQTKQTEPMKSNLSNQTYLPKPRGNLYLPISVICDHWIFLHMFPIYCHCDVKVMCDVKEVICVLSRNCVIFGVVDLVSAVNAWVGGAFGQFQKLQKFSLGSCCLISWAMFSDIQYLQKNYIYLLGFKL